MEHVYQKVSNMEFANTSTGMIFRCLMEECTFESNDNRVFGSHLRVHLNDGGVKENSSFCTTCNISIRAENVSGEFQHVLKHHIRKTEVTVKEEMIETTVLQQDISTDEGQTEDEESENVTHTSVENLKPIDEIKIELEEYRFSNSDYEVSEMFEYQPPEGFKEIPVPPQVFSTVLQPDSAAQTAAHSTGTAAKNNDHRSPSKQRSSSSHKKNTSSSHVESSDKSSSNLKSSSRKTSTSQSSEGKSLSCSPAKNDEKRLKSDKEEKNSGKDHSKKDKSKSESRTRHSSSSSSKSHSKKSSSKKSSSSRDKAKPTETITRPKRNASSSPSRELSPDKKVRLQNLKVEPVELELISTIDEKTLGSLSETVPLPLPKKFIEKNIQFDSQGNVPSTSTFSENIDKNKPGEKPIEMLSEYGTIPSKKIIGKIPKKVPVVVNCMTGGSSTSNQSIVASSPLTEEQTLTRKNASALMPWALTLKRDNFKCERSWRSMTTKQELVKLYKCMGDNCSYTHSNFERFLSHLEDHTKQKSDNSFYQMCPYCQFRHVNVTALANHIRNIHKFDRFQCRFCFFRSQEPGTVCEHHLVHHNDLTAAILECPGKNERSQESVEQRENMMIKQHSKKLMCKCEFTRP